MVWIARLLSMFGMVWFARMFSIAIGAFIVLMSIPALKDGNFSEFTLVSAGLAIILLALVGMAETAETEAKERSAVKG